MNKRKNYIKLSIVLIIIVGIGILFSYSKEKSDRVIRNQILGESYELIATGEIPSYLTYLDQHRDDLAMGGEEIILSASEYSSHDLTSFIDNGDGSVNTGNEGSITYEFELERKGSYVIQVEYLPNLDSNMATVRDLLVNDSYLFEELKGITFERAFMDENKAFVNKTDKNQAIPLQIQRNTPIKKQLEASDKSISGPFLFYLKEGLNRITFKSVKDSLIIKEIRLIPSNGLETYDAYLKRHLENGSKKISSSDLEKVIIVQAEDALSKTTSTIVPVNDRTSAKTMPYHPSNIILNTIGGDTWELVGSGISWEVTVPKAGLYKIGVRFSQGMNRDFYSVRELKINGAVPFIESGNLHFPYDSKFQNKFLGSNKEAYYFYLDEGVNQFSMTVALGDLSYAIRETKQSVKNFNQLYRRLQAVMGTNPDMYRDYNILNSVPDMVSILKTEYYRLNLVMESLGDSINNSTKTREIVKLLYQIEKIVKKPDNIAKEFKVFNDNITALSEWMLSLSNQPLILDYFTICYDDYELEAGEGNFLKRVGHMVSSFIGSFTNDYIVDDMLASEKEKQIEVWIATSTRDQFDIARRMVNNAFKDSKIGVELKMVGADTVMPATLTGNGPDVAIQLNYTMPTNFAYREAGYDLTEFEDFNEVAKQFSSGAMEYFSYQRGYYALPDQMSFPVMYYRKDILEEIGLEVPNTWDEVLAMIPTLKAKNMSIWFTTTGHTILGGYSSTATKPVNSVFLSLLYQQGEELYKENGLKSNLDSMTSLLTFKYWTEFYTKQSFQLHISTVTRFRTGEVPIFIDDYTVQNSILAAAPEIDGVWDIAPIPGSLMEDGTMNRSTPAMVGASMILRNMVEQKGTKEEAWEFLKWWTSKDTQLQYALEQKAILGEAAIFPVANIEALKELAVNEEKDEAIDETLKWLKGMPQVPGGYLTGRAVENAFLSVFYNNVNPVDTLYQQIKDINSELDSKHKEFGLIP